MAQNYESIAMGQAIREHDEALGAKRVTLVDAASSYTTRLDEGATYTYVGKAVAGTLGSAASWQIMRYPSADFSAGLFADGDASFDNIWDDHPTLSYS